jgi:(1->4)-alpha-D-glucan 1-alpha-D-glucosylmutase
MTFDRARTLIPRLRELGISHVYASPLFTASEGSTHGYDAINCNEIEPAIGGRQGFDRFSAELANVGMGIILDIVPNHMAANLQNGWWRNIVEWGQRSPFKDHFDIDWAFPLSLPVLEKSFSESVQEGAIALMCPNDSGHLAMSYAGQAYPLGPETYALVLGKLDEPLALQLIHAAAEATPLGSSSFHDRVKAIVSVPSSRNRLEDVLKQASSDVEFMDLVHHAQQWQLYPWRDASARLNYRRFFDITGLVGLRVEDRQVFEAVHALTFELLDNGQIDGLRIDHIDGLADPAEYLSRLRQRIGDERYLLVEKILQRDETLPQTWTASGTTGYEFIAAVSDVFVDPDGWSVLGEAYQATVDAPLNLATETRNAKLQVLNENFKNELSSLAKFALNLLDLGLDVTAEVENAIAELIVAFPVYRTYGTADGLSRDDARLLDQVFQTASQGRTENEVVRMAAILNIVKGSSDNAKDAAWDFRRKFQQLTGPVMAKAIEDTLFYRYNHLIALNEVGGELAPSPVGAAHFHRLMRHRSETRDFSLSATSTHDTKRGEDARTLLYVLTEAPEIWISAFRRWQRMNANLRSRGETFPKASDEWLVYQALAGVWPSHVETHDGLVQLRERFAVYLEKAMREAKSRTSWLHVDANYEAAIQGFAARLLADANRAFLDDFGTTIQPFLRAGRIKSLGQVLLKIAAPGVPDIYQGSEDWNYSLVDPDNRRPIQTGAASISMDSDGVRLMSKRELIARAMNFRRCNRALFDRGTYQAIELCGDHRGKFFAFGRELKGEVAIVIITALSDLSVPNKECENIHLNIPALYSSKTFIELFSSRLIDSDQPIMVTKILTDYPVAILTTIVWS